MVRVYSSPILREAITESERKALIADFKAYKGEGRLPHTFGRDVPYDHPQALSSLREAQVRHLHLAAPGTAWSERLFQFHRTSDQHLVYCTGERDQACYLLIAILRPKAHRLAWDRNIMAALAEYAERFRDLY